MIAGKQVGIQAHIGCAARVGVVGEADEPGSGNAGAECHQAGDVVAKDFGAEDDYQIQFGFQLVAETEQCVFAREGGGNGIGCRIVAGKECGELALGRLGNLRKGCGLPPQLN